MVTFDPLTSWSAICTRCTIQSCWSAYSNLSFLTFLANITLGSLKTIVSPRASPSLWPWFSICSIYTGSTCFSRLSYKSTQRGALLKGSLMHVYSYD